MTMMAVYKNERAGITVILLTNFLIPCFQSVFWNLKLHTVTPLDITLGIAIMMPLNSSLLRDLQVI